MKKRYPNQNNLKSINTQRKGTSAGKKGALEMSFSWLFAIIVGSFILFLAIYGVTKGLQSGQVEQSALIGKEISTLLNPLETGFEAGKTSSLSLSSDTRLYNKCDNFGEFGTQYLEVSQKSFGDWVKTNFDITFSNKYIFSENYVEGKKFFFFSKPFEFPFKVADVIYMTSSSDFYCFVEPPEEIKEEIEALNQKNIQIDDCGKNSIKVCFDYNSNCEIKVNENSKSVEKIGEDEVYFETNALMYAAIFSGKQEYECQVKRLLQRLGNLAILYDEKESITASSGSCSREVGTDLNVLKNSAESITDSGELVQLRNIVDNIERSNERAYCALW